MDLGSKVARHMKYLIDSAKETPMQRIGIFVPSDNYLQILLGYFMGLTGIKYFVNLRLVKFDNGSTIAFYCPDERPKKTFEDEVDDMIRKSLGHSFHKSMVLFDQPDVIEQAKLRTRLGPNPEVL